MVRIGGGRGKVVWLPTWDAEFNEYRMDQDGNVTAPSPSDPFVRVVEAGAPVPPLVEIFALIAEHGLVLAMGHSTPEEVLLLIPAAKAQGVRHILSRARMTVLRQEDVQSKLGALPSVSHSELRTIGLELYPSGTQGRTIDATLPENRFANWEITGSVQQELVSGVSVDVGYFRRSWINHSAQNDRAVGLDDFDIATVTVPEDPRLPGGGGGTLRFYDLSPEAVRVPDEIRTNADNFGGESETWSGVDILVDARVENILLQGGVSTGRESRDFCDRQSLLPEATGENPLEHCNRSENWLTEVKFLGSYTFPGDWQVAGTFRNQPGPERAAEVQFTAADTDLGRRMTLYPSAVGLNVIEPGSFYGDRLNQFDVAGPRHGGRL